MVGDVQVGVISFHCTRFLIFFKINTVLGIFVALVIIVFFGFLVRYYKIQQYHLRITENKIVINNDELKALEHHFIPVYDGSEFIGTDHPYCYDMDIFGEGSVFQFLNRTVTLLGRNNLAERLLNRLPDRKSISLTQDTIKEMSAKMEYRQQFLANGMIKQIEFNCWVFIECFANVECSLPDLVTGMEEQVWKMREGMVKSNC